jgi:hypothetical protein
MNFMTKVISGGLNNIKRNQTLMPSTEVVEAGEVDELDQLKKLLR